MLPLFSKLPGYTSRGKSSPGLERKILRAMPYAFLTIIFLCGLPSVMVRLMEWKGGDLAVEAFIGRVDMLAIGVFFTLFNAAFVVTTGAVLVTLMKGPGYVADGYKLIDSDSPEELSDKPWVGDR
ncbi:MAG: hypothetical protein WCX93_08770 [Burkholderiaceae bacterium]